MPTDAVQLMFAIKENPVTVFRDLHNSIGMSPPKGEKSNSLA